MRRTIPILMVAVLAGGLVVGGSGLSSEAQTETRTQVFEYPGPYFRFLDLGKPGVSPGDMRLQIWDLLDPVDETVVGDSVMQVWVVRLPRGDRPFTIILDCTVRLADGNIAFHGPVRTYEFGALPVVGGPGAYVGATGTVTIEPATLSARTDSCGRSI